MNIQKLSQQYRIKRLYPQDIPEIYVLCLGNPLYFRYLHDSTSFDHILADMKALPPGKTMEDKYFIGYYHDTQLIAVLDLILDYPYAQYAYIGWFMVDHSQQGTGCGTAIIQELLLACKQQGMKHSRLGFVKGNPQAEHFWKKQGFQATHEEVPREKDTIVLMERTL